VGAGRLVGGVIRNEHRGRQVSFTSSLLLSPWPAKAVIKRQNCEANFRVSSDQQLSLSIEKSDVAYCFAGSNWGLV